MAKPESFDKNAEVIVPIWGGLAAIHRKPGSRQRLRVRWFRITGSVVGVAALTWLMVAVGLYFWFKLGRGFQDEKFSDVLGLPFHWPPFHSAVHDKLEGDYFYHAGDWATKNKHLEDAYNDYRIAVMKTPDNLDARLKYASFSLAATKNLDLYFSILEDGIPFAIAQNQPDYLNNYFVNLIKAQLADRSQHIETICKKYLAQKIKDPKVDDVFALNLANVYIDEGRFDEADDIIKKYQLNRSLDGVILTSRLYWESGQLHEAVAYIEKMLPRANYNDELLGLLSHYYRDLGNLDESRHYTSMRELANPSNVVPQIELLYIYAKSGDQASEDKSVQNIIAQFHDNAQDMTLLAAFETDQGNVAEATAIYDMVRKEDQQLRLAAKPSDFNLASFALLVAEAYLTNNDYPGTIKFLDQLNAEKPDWLADNLIFFNSMRAVAEYALGQQNDATAYVNNLIQSNRTRPDQLLLIANRFLSHGAAPLAQKILAQANHMDPHNQVILSQLVATNLQLGISENMDQNIQSLLDTRRPPAELLYDVYRQLSSDHFIFVPNRDKLLAELDQFLSNAAKNQFMASADSSGASS